MLSFILSYYFLYFQSCGREETEYTSTFLPTLLSHSLHHQVYVPVLHACELGGGLLEVMVVAVGEGAQAAGDQGHGAEAGAGLAGCVGAAGVLLAVLAVSRGLQPVVRACKGYLHGC